MRLMPRLPPSSRSLRLFSWASICFMGPWTFAWIRCPQLPYHPCKNRTHSTCFTAQGGTRRKTDEKLTKNCLTLTKFGKKGLGMAAVQMNVLMNNSEQFEGTAHENVGVRGNKGQKVHPNFATNIAMGFHCHTFCPPPETPKTENPYPFTSLG